MAWTVQVGSTGRPIKRQADGRLLAFIATVPCSPLPSSSTPSSRPRSQTESYPTGDGVTACLPSSCVSRSVQREKIREFSG
jgi:hypothetical protein